MEKFKSLLGEGLYAELKTTGDSSYPGASIDIVNKDNVRSGIAVSVEKPWDENNIVLRIWDLSGEEPSVIKRIPVKDIIKEIEGIHG